MLWRTVLYKCNQKQWSILLIYATEFIAGYHEISLKRIYVLDTCGHNLREEVNIPKKFWEVWSSLSFNRFNSFFSPLKMCLTQGSRVKYYLGYRFSMAGKTIPAY